MFAVDSELNSGSITDEQARQKKADIQRECDFYSAMDGSSKFVSGNVKAGIFITEQVGSENDRELVEMVLPDTEKPFPHLNLREQRKAFEDAGFHIIEEAETFRPIRFYDVGAFVWFAHIIEWEFPGFSVDRCFDQLLKMQEIIESGKPIEGTIHRYLIVARKE